MAMLCFAQSSFAQNKLAKKVTVAYNQQRLSYILEDLGKSHKLRFSYNNADLELNKKISIRLKAQPLSSVLNALCIETGLQWQQVGEQIILKPNPKRTADSEEPSKSLFQTIRGVVIDKESNMPIPGVTVAVSSADKRTSTNSEGEFRFRSIPVGRHEIEFSALGYKKTSISQVLVSSGKELVLTIPLTESITDLNVVYVSANKDVQRPLNDMATVSARSFSTEETSRYAGSAFDPARMAQSFAGVTAGNDINNDIVIRGNSSKGLQWRLEGIEIINPNHFGEEGSSAGGISMISSGMLTNSDFFTGAFPAEYGNALSGVFDLQFRKGNTEKNEYAFMAGLLGTEATVEGPFKKGGKSSYLINYRYSTLGILEQLGISPAGEGRVPIYQDLAFNLNFPTKTAGTFSLFGIGGISSQKQQAERDYTVWESLDDKFDRRFGYNSGSAGLKHLLSLNKKIYLKNILSYSGNRITDDVDSLSNTYEKSTYGRDTYINESFRYSGLVNYKVNSKNTVRAGIISSLLTFDLNSLVYKKQIDRLSNLLQAQGSAWNQESFVQWKHQFNDKLSVNSGLHASYFNLSETVSIEPRAGLNWWIKPNQQVSLGAGVHSRLEPMAFYFARNELPDGTVIESNRELSPSKALHIVAGYERSFRNRIKFKAEAYYQHLFNVPVSNDPAVNFSTINSADAYMIYARNYRALTNKGKGTNTGLELTLEKSLSQGYYFLITSSLFDSKFSPLSGKKYNTNFNSNYVGNIVSGKEWKTGSSNKNLFGINTKVVYTGGRPYTPINLEESLREDYQTVFEDQINTIRTSPYFRLDLSVNYRINRPKLSHAIFLDIQNIMNRRNELGEFFNSDKNKIEKATLAGMIPSLYYRIEF